MTLPQLQALMDERQRLRKDHAADLSASQRGQSHGLLLLARQRTRLDELEELVEVELAIRRLEGT